MNAITRKKAKPLLSNEYDYEKRTTISIPGEEAVIKCITMVPTAIINKQRLPEACLIRDKADDVRGASNTIAAERRGYKTVISFSLASRCCLTQYQRLRSTRTRYETNYRGKGFMASEGRASTGAARGKALVSPRGALGV